LSIYILKEPEMPWGDYGDILAQGMTDDSERQNGLLLLERTGPFVPPISMPGLGVIVVTESFKRTLNESGLSGISYKPVIKSHIIYLEWEKWDWKADDPEEYPETGEPEDYIMEKSHSPKTAEKMEDLWEVCLDKHVDIELAKEGITENTGAVLVLLSTWDGTDWFTDGRKTLHVYISEKAKDWLKKTVPEWINFELVLTK